MFFCILITRFGPVHVSPVDTQWYAQKRAYFLNLIHVLPYICRIHNLILTKYRAHLILQFLRFEKKKMKINSCEQTCW